MNTLLRKEFRLLLPALVATVVMVVVPTWGTHFAWFARNGWMVGMAALVCFTFGILFLALSPFGQEISLGTFSLMLAQPRPRQEIWWVKMGALGATVALSLAVLGLSWYLRGKGTVIMAGVPFSNTLRGVGPLLGMAALAALVMASGGLWTTLVFRQVTAAFWFSLLVPAAIFTAVEFVTVDGGTIVLREAIVMGTYSIFGFILAAKLFLEAQDKPQGQEQISLPSARGHSLHLLAFAFSRKRSAWAALFCKELQLHQITLIAAAGLGLGLVGLELIYLTTDLVTSAGGFARRGFIYDLVEWSWKLWLLVPFMIGSVAVADERRFNTLSGQLCLPARKRSVFAGKFLAVLFLGGLLGALIPWLLVCIAYGAGALFHPGVRTYFPSLSTLAAFAVPCAMIAAISFYASTLSQTSIQALGIAFVLNLLTFYTLSIILPVHQSSDGYGQLRTADTYRWEPVSLCKAISQFFQMDLHLNAWAWPMAVATYLWLSYENFQRLQMNPRVWLRNLIALVIVATGTLFVSNVVHARPWERFMRLEPVHGPARIVETATRHVEMAGACVLLPDGRVWMRHSMRSIEEMSKPGVFVGESNWIDVTPFWDGAIGIQSDHTLWQIDSLAKTRRIGGDSNWQTVAACGSSFLALRNDGTLWRSPAPIFLETNTTGEIWANGRVWLTLANPDTVPVPMENYPSNWASLINISGTPIGVYGDGTVWRFLEARDFIARRPGAGSGLSYNIIMQSAAAAETNWLSAVQVASSFWAGVSRDGGLWASGNLPNRLFGHDCPTGQHGQPVRIAGKSEWREVSGGYPAMAAVENPGTLWLQFAEGWGKTECPSAYSDWIAVTATGGWITALGADGTLSTWEMQYQSALGLPEPRQRPVASVNIFDTQ